MVATSTTPAVRFTARRFSWTTRTTTAASAMPAPPRNKLSIRMAATQPHTWRPTAAAPVRAVPVHGRPSVRVSCRPTITQIAPHSSTSRVHASTSLRSIRRPGRRLQRYHSLDLVIPPTPSEIHKISPLCDFHRLQFSFEPIWPPEPIALEVSIKLSLLIRRLVHTRAKSLISEMRLELLKSILGHSNEHYR